MERRTLRRPRGTEGFPTTVYVHRETAARTLAAREDAYMVVHATPPHEAEDGASVAIYRLVEVKTLRVTRRLE